MSAELVFCCAGQYVACLGHDVIHQVSCFVVHQYSECSDAMKHRASSAVNDRMYQVASERQAV